MGRERMIRATIAMLFVFQGCTLELPNEGCGPGTNRTCGPVTTLVNDQVYNTLPGLRYQDTCWPVPYNESVLWCDAYDDGSCCVWMIDGWYEEWCNYDGMLICWEYNGSF